MTANLRKPDPGDGDHRWELRRDRCLAAIIGAGPDVVMAQEVRRIQRDDFLERLPTWRCWGQGRAPGDPEPVNLVAWNHRRWDLEDQGGWWLSTRPHQAGSRSWGSASIRLVSWALLRRRADGLLIRAISTHLDHISAEARIRGAALLADESGSWPADMPQILGADLNDGEDSPTARALLDGGWMDCAGGAGQDRGPTFHGFRGPLGCGDHRRIDWLLARGGLTTRRCWTIRQQQPPYASDHWFIAAELAPACTGT
jgi:endonuclease/exonuclease/phosphatase family metal-dependent hydrolase